MSIGGFIAVIAGAGAIGGVINALTSQNGFALPKTEKVDGVEIVRPGFLTNVVIGAVAAAVSWGLYGPAANVAILSTGPVTAPAITLSFASIAGAIVAGVGGARWLTNEVDKKLLRAAASVAASRAANPNVAAKISQLSPAKVLDEARSMVAPPPGG